MLAPAAPWPATTGGLVRIAAILHQVARHCDVTFVAPRRADQQPPADRGIRFVCPVLPEPGASRRAAALLHPSRPFHVSLYGYTDVRDIVRHELATQPFDLVYGHFYYSLQYLHDARVPVVIDQQNVDRMYWRNKAEHSAFPLGVVARWNTWRTVAYEDRHLSRIWGYVSVSDQDREQTRAYAAPRVKHFWVAPNGVDTRRFTPGTARNRDPRRLTLGYLGSMSLQMNVEAVERICRTLLPAIRRRLPDLDVRFLVIGSQPSPAVRELNAATPGMSLSGSVPDVVPWLQQVDVLVSPLRIGAGTKLKVAEAMSCALPVVGSSLAFAGLPGQSGEHYVRADRDDDFVDAVSRLAASPDERARMGSAARELARAHLEWDVIGDRLAADLVQALRQEGRLGGS
jgi:glycosyltransferase involved in cell wall biosynthesis